MGRTATSASRSAIEIVERADLPTMPESIPSRFPAISTTRWSRIACARRRWSAAASWAASRRGSRRSTRCATTAASETRYNADPQRPDRRRTSLCAQRGAEILAIYHSHPRWEAVPSQTDLAREPLRAGAPDHRLAARRSPRTSASGGSIPTRYEELAWRIVEPEPIRRRCASA